MNRIETLLALLVLFSLPSSGGEELVLRRLESPPVSITETFFEIPESGNVRVGGELLRKIIVRHEDGKSHAAVTVHYSNKTPVAASPRYVLRLYNPYGILMGGHRVTEEMGGPETLVEPQQRKEQELVARMQRLDSLLRNTTLDGYPDDFLSLRWVSIEHSNDRIIDRIGTSQYREEPPPTAGSAGPVVAGEVPPPLQPWLQIRLIGL